MWRGARKSDEANLARQSHSSHIQTNKTRIKEDLLESAEDCTSSKAPFAAPKSGRFSWNGLDLRTCGALQALLSARKLSSSSCKQASKQARSVTLLSNHKDLDRGAFLQNRVAENALVSV